jgi:hypothetical protein
MKIFINGTVKTPFVISHRLFRRQKSKTEKKYSPEYFEILKTLSKQKLYTKKRKRIKEEKYENSKEKIEKIFQN